MYAQRYAGGFVNGDASRQADATLFNNIEAALISLFGVTPATNGALVWDGTKFTAASLIKNAQIDATAAIDKTKLGPLSITDADVAGGALIAGSKLNLASTIVQPTHFAAGSKITTSAYSGGPPGSPGDKDIWIATGVEGTAHRWVFQFDSAWVTDVYKWKFVGGAPITLQQDASITVAATATPNQGVAGTGTVAAVTYTPLRSGVYLARHTCTLSNTNSVSVSVFINMGGTNYSGTSGIPTAGGFVPGFVENEQACGGSSSIVPAYSNNASGTLTVTVRRLVVVPSRII